MSARVFRPGRRGSATVFGPLEASVMDAVWAAGAPVMVSDVMKALTRRKKSLAYSTIKTILCNLAEKGYLVKRSVGRANAFATTLTKADFEREIVGEVVGSLLRDYRSRLLVHLADELAADPESITALEHLLAEREKKKPPHA